MQRLDVLNECLETMGHTPLTSIDERHPLRAPALAKLDQKNRTIQAKGWWFNMEDVTLTPDVSGKVILPGDCLEFRSDVHRYVKRGAVLYNLDDSTDIFTADVKGVIIRLIPFDDVCEQMAEFIAATTVKDFQLAYDGDSDKQNKLARRVAEASVNVNAEHTRQSKQNAIASNYTIQRIRGFARELNYYPR